MTNPIPQDTLTHRHLETEDAPSARAPEEFDAAAVGPLTVALERGAGPLVVLLHGFPEQATLAAPGGPFS